MNKKLYIGNLPYNTTEDQMIDFFSSEGEIVSLKIIKDKFTGRSKGFGFLEMGTPEEAQNVMSKFNGKDFEGRPLRVDIASERVERSDRGGDRGGERGHAKRGGYRER